MPNLPSSLRLRSPWQLAALAAAATAACDSAPAVDSVSDSVVYGDDNRRDVYDYADQSWAKRAAGFTAAMVATDDIDDRNPQDIGLAGLSLGDAYRLCDGERFFTQPTAAGCSTTLIGPDLILTAGHCIDDADCPGTSFVFDYYMTSASALQSITRDDVYRCEEVVVHALVESPLNLDYAVVRLDRPVTGRKPVRIDPSETALAVNTPLIVNGYGSGLPLKIDDGAKVRDSRASTRDFFVSNLDTFGGNSGSGVFRNDTNRLVGILVRGDEDYVDTGTCYRVNECEEDGCGGESSTYAFQALKALCAKEPDAFPCTPCTDADSDGACNDEEDCPQDASKFDAGACGCGVADTDSDADRSADCVDECDADPNKDKAGACGCGVAETDADADGEPDCVDACPMDAENECEEGGGCGCRTSGDAGAAGSLLLLGLVAARVRRRGSRI